MSEPTPTISTHDTKELIALGRSLGAPVGVTKTHGRGIVPSLVVPEGFKVVPATLEAEVPSHAQADICMTDIGSFIKYIIDFGIVGQTRIFADRKRQTFKAFIDYHRPSGSDAVIPGHNRHMVSLTPDTTSEWDAWTSRNGEPSNQEDFARFLEDWSVNIVEPDAATLIETAASMEATKSVQFKSARRLSNGQREFTYNETVNGTTRSNNMVIPEQFKLSLARTFGSEPITLTAKFRYRISEGELVVWYDLLRLDILMEADFRQMLQIITDKTGIAPYIGDGSVTAALKGG